MLCLLAIISGVIPYSTHVFAVIGPIQATTEEFINVISFNILLRMNFVNFKQSTCKYTIEAATKSKHASNKNQQGAGSNADIHVKKVTSVNNVSYTYYEGI